MALPLPPDALVAALRSLSGPSPGSAAHGGTVKDAECSLLDWEGSDPDSYALALLSVLLHPVAAGRWVDGGGDAEMPRLAALLSLKAAVLRRWKERGRGGGGRAPHKLMGEEAKAAVRRSALLVVTLAGLSEGLAGRLARDRTLQANASALLARIGRLDLPLRFHELIPALVDCTTTNVSPTTPSENIDGLSLSCDLIRRANGAVALEAVLAELCAKRLLVDKKYVTSVTQAHFKTLVDRAIVPAFDDVRRNLSGSGSSDVARAYSFDFAMTVIKVLRHLLVSSLPSLVDKNATVETEGAVDRSFALALELVPGLGLCVHGFAGGAEVSNTESAEHLLTELCDLVVEVQKYHPLSFARYLSPFLDLFYDNLCTAQVGSGSQRGQAGVDNTLSLAAMRFLANVSGCSHYEQDEAANEGAAALQTEGVSGRAITARGDTSTDAAALQTAVHTVWGAFLTPERLATLAEVAVRRYMVLSPQRLEEWGDDPEAYFHTEEHRNADEDPESAAQNLYLALAESKAGRIVVSPVLVRMLSDIEGQVRAAQEEADAAPVIASTSSLVWDALYIAAGVSLDLLEGCDGFTFWGWYDACLWPSLNILLRNNKQKILSPPVLRHRILWLLGCHAHRIPADRRRHLYGVLVAIIADQSYDRGNDAKVKLTVVRALQNLLYDPDDSLDVLWVHTEGVVEFLYRLASDCIELESRTQVLACVSLILSTMAGSGVTISEGAANIAVMPLETVWANAVDQFALLRRDVLSILASIAVAVGRELAPRLSPVALPAIDQSLDPTYRDQNLVLAEDALALWLTLLRSAPVYTSEWGRLFRRANDVLGQGDLEHTKIVLVITEWYIIFGGAAFLQECSDNVAAVLAQVVGQVRPRGAAYVGLVLEALLRRFPIESGELLLRGGIVGIMLRSCAANWMNSDACEPDRVVVLYLTALSRALLGTPNLLDRCLPVHVINKKASSTFGPDDLINMIFKLFHSLEAETSGHVQQRLWAMCLLSLLPPTPSTKSYEQPIMKGIDQLMEILLIVLLRERNETGKGFLVPYSIGYDSEEEIVGTGLDRYESMLRIEVEQDIAFKTNVRSTFKNKMQNFAEHLASTLGSQAYEEVLSMVEPATLQQIEKAIAD